MNMPNTHAENEELEKNALLNDGEKPEAEEAERPLTAAEKKAKKAAEKAEAKAKADAEAEEEADEVKPAPKMTANQATRIAQDNMSLTKKRLDAEEKVNFMLPVDPSDSANLPEEVTINGVRTVVPRGEMTLIPVSVQKILMEKYKIHNNLGKNALAGRSKAVEEALS